MNAAIVGSYQQTFWRRRYWWVIPKPIDLITTLLYLGFLLTTLGYEHPPLGSAILMSGAIVVLLAIDRWEYWRYGNLTPYLMRVLLLLARIALIELVCLVEQFHLSPFLYLIPPLLGAITLGAWAGWLLAALAWGAYAVKHLINTPHWLTDSFEVHFTIIFSLGLGFVLIMARLLLREQLSRNRAEQLLAEVEASQRQLRVYAARVEELATVQERNRLAREFHDSLGHYLTIINVQLEKAQTFRQRDAAQADQAVNDAKRLASAALADVRQSVAALRSTPAPFSCAQAVEALAASMRLEEWAITCAIAGDEAGFPSQSLFALYRAAQEGLTNIHKHAQARQIDIALRFDDDEARLTIVDDGRGFDPDVTTQRAGSTRTYGLQGIQERMELVGGCMQIKSHPGMGTTLAVTVPKTFA